MHGDYEGGLVNPDGPEAADQLERYRVALEGTRDHCPQCDGEGVYEFGLNEVPCEFCEYARQALEAK